MRSRIYALKLLLISLFVVFANHSTAQSAHDSLNLDKFLAHYQKSKLRPVIQHIKHLEQKLVKDTPIWFQDLVQDYVLDGVKLHVENHVEDSITAFDGYMQWDSTRFGFKDLPVWDFYDSVMPAKSKIDREIGFLSGDPEDYGGTYMKFQHKDKLMYLLRSVPMHCNGTGCWNSWLFIVIVDKASRKTTVRAIEYYQYYDIFPWSKDLFCYNPATGKIDSMCYVSTVDWHEAKIKGELVPFSISFTGEISTGKSVKIDQKR